jgi:two-component system, chemotaxis family, response regulator PixG
MGKFCYIYLQKAPKFLKKIPMSATCPQLNILESPKSYSHNLHTHYAILEKERYERNLSLKYQKVHDTGVNMLIKPQGKYNTLSSDLTIFSQKQFTGKLEIGAARGQQWCFYLSMGRLVWATVNIHATRRWQRHLAQHCPEINPHEITFRPTDRFECFEYHLLAILARRGTQVGNRPIAPEKILAIIEGIVTEVLFDLFQILETEDQTSQNTQADPSNSLSMTAIAGVRPSDDGILPSTWMLDVETVINKTQEIWQLWDKAGLGNYSPNLAPVLKQPERLQEQISADAYKNLAALINGQRTLRSLALLMKQDVLKVTRSLLPYIKQQLIELIPVPDSSNPNPITTALSTTKKKEHRIGNQPTLAAPILKIACIDDSPQMCLIMEEIFTTAGYQFIEIQDSVQALPTLVEDKPDLIFLDLLMPIANGYEICAQIRRMAIFQNIPVIILTSNDGVIDRVRAKLVGATDFISKPVEPEKILATVRKYCSVTSNNH